MPKKILAVGLSIGSDHVEYSNFSEKTSLLDWDIVLFRPDIEAFTRYYYSNTEYQGKTCLDDTQSFRLRESCEHWRREIKEIVESGKNVIVFLNEPEELFIATGTKDFSGTGRNQKITRHVAPYSSYESIPIDYSWTTTQGSSMTVSQDVKALLGSYWNRFSKHSTYNVVWQNDAKQACMYTKHGKKPVSLLLRSKSGGTLLLLPDLDFDKTTFFTTRDGEEVYTKAGIEFGTSLVAEIVALDKILHSTFQRTPEPSWAKENKYSLSTETTLQQDLLVAETELERAQKKKEDVTAQLEKAGNLRSLLFENGAPLESAILEALRILGFSANNFDDGKSEFDAIFESAEGRLLGEAEGKDSKPINVEKLRQLSMNIQEDLERNEVTSPAKGVLFGNGYRLIDPRERGEQFTDKCMAAASTTSVALVSTNQLFLSVKYLLNNNDENYARLCREAIFNSIGIVSLPTPPEDVNGQPLESVEDQG